MVRIHPDPPICTVRRYGTTRLLVINFAVPCLVQHKLVGEAEILGAIAQMGERLICIQEVGGSIPPGSTIIGTPVAIN